MTVDDYGDRPIVLTGGASGIGRAITLRLLTLGYPVGVLDQSADGLESLRAEADSDRLQTFTVDITDYELVKAAVTEFAAASGPPFGLVNNAGWDHASWFAETTPEFWRKIVDINLYGPLNATHVVLPYLVAAGRGRVVSIASDAGRIGSAQEAVYSATKGGTIAFMKSLAWEHARHGLTFNSVCPGATDTPLFRSFDETGRKGQILERMIPMRRLAQPDDYPGLVALLLSDDASYITGQVISVSGGLSMSG